MTESLPAKARLAEAMKAALKAGDKPRLGALRLIHAEIQRAEVDARKNLDEPGLVALLERMVKQRREAAEQYRRGGREELAAREEAEIAVIREFLPEPLSEAEVTALVEEALAACGARTARDLGAVMQYLKPRLQGRADLGEVSRRVRARLQG
ncbi:MAG: aspartyl-tRNA amidotransferase subunit B [Porticoccaceae bacterium]|nr:MAG: aspartyl-tRNA amidotransferase subunit B [Porticoccaceae bacterium]